MKKLILAAVMALTMANAGNKAQCIYAMDKSTDYLNLSTIKMKQGIDDTFEVRMAREYLVQQLVYCKGLLPNKDLKQRKEFIKGLTKQLENR